MTVAQPLRASLAGQTCARLACSKSTGPRGALGCGGRVPAPWRVASRPRCTRRNVVPSSIASPEAGSHAPAAGYGSGSHDGSSGRLGSVLAANNCVPAAGVAASAVSSVNSGTIADVAGMVHIAGNSILQAAAETAGVVALAGSDSEAAADDAGSMAVHISQDEIDQAVHIAFEHELENINQAVHEAFEQELGQVNEVITENINQTVIEAVENALLDRTFDIKANFNTMIALTGVILYWRGIWNLFDTWLGTDNVMANLGSVLIGLSVILLFRIFKLPLAEFW